MRALVPRMNLDELFEQKGEVAKHVLEELAKVIVSNLFSSKCFKVWLLLVSSKCLSRVCC